MTDTQFERTWWVPLGALMAPLILWPVEWVLPYPYLIEEMVKAWLVGYYVPKLQSSKSEIRNSKQIRNSKSKTQNETSNSKLQMTNAMKSFEIVGPLVVGVVFGVAETLFFTINAILSGQIGVLVGRVFFTMPMHVVTTFMSYWGVSRSGVWKWVGLAMAMATHYWFNQWAM
jgi:hypothetical protein